MPRGPVDPSPVDKRIEFRILGPVEVLVDGQAVPLGGRKQRMVVAALLLRPNEVVSVDELIDVLWGQPAPIRAAKSLHVYIWQLRKLLGHEVLRTRAPGYSLAVAPTDLDLQRFESLLAAARHAPPDEAAALLQEALGLFRGRPLADFAYENFAEGEIARIEELRLQAFEERIDADLSLGRHADIVGELESLVAENPLRERLRSQLMLGLYRCGRQAEALAAYQEARRLLVEGLGLEPGRELQALQTAILRHDRALDAPATEPGGEAPVEARAPVEPPEPREERKVVTVLVAAIADATASADAADPEDLRAALRPFQTAARREIEVRGGVVERFTGATVMAVFGGRVSHEDDAERAVLAALAIRDWVTQERDHLQTWIGVDTGVALVSLDSRPDETMATVDVANAAERLQAAAPDGGILVGAQTYRLTRDVVEYRAAPPVAARGKRESIQAWEASRERSRRAATRAVVPFVGRQHELDLLLSALARARSERSPQLVTLIGVPGIGKSRLVLELFDRVEREDERVTWRQGRCLPYGDGVSFWALGEMVKAQAGILESDDPGRAREKLAAAVAAVVDDASQREWVTTRLGPLVGARLGEAAGSAERTEAFTAWRRFLEALADQRPTILVFEDLHWADESLLDFLDELTSRARDVPLLALCTARPELLTRRPGWGSGQPNSLTISLRRLSDEETATVLEAASDGGMPAEAREAIVERAAGNPLYAEQFARMLDETGAFEALPETVHGIIAARLDALSAEEKELLHDAAVVGKVFWAGALEAISGGSRPHSGELLDGLERKEFVQRSRRPSIAGEAEYAFRHVLLRDVAYEQIPRLARAAKHRRAAQWIERIAADRLTDHAEILAHHYARALHLARAAGAAEDAIDLAAATRRFLVLSGDRAFALDAAAAATYYGDALELLAPGDPGRAAVLTRAAEAAWQTGRFAAAVQSYEEAISELRALGSRLALGEAVASLSLVHAWHGDTERARVLLTEAVALLEQEPPARELAQAYAHLARDRTLAGRHREGLDWAEKSLALADHLGLKAVSVVARQYRGFIRCHLGDLEGLGDLRAAVDAGVGLGLGQECVRAQVNHGFCVWFLDGPSRALDLYRAAIAHGEQRGIDALVLRAHSDVLWLLFELGEWDELLRLGAELVAWERRHGGTYFGVTPLTYRACVLTYRGAVEEAAALSDDFVSTARRVGELQLLAPALTIGAQVEAALGRVSNAVSLVQEFADATTDDPVSRSNHVVAAMRVCVAAGEFAFGERLLETGKVVMARQRHSLVAARAILTEAVDAREEAALLFDDAAAAWEGYGHVLEHGQALLGLGRCRLALGRDAHDPLVAAHEIFARLGARQLVAEANELLARTVPARSPQNPVPRS